MAFGGYAGSGWKYSSWELNATDIMSGPSFISGIRSSSRAPAMPYWMMPSALFRIAVVISSQPSTSSRLSFFPSSWMSASSARTPCRWAMAAPASRQRTYSSAIAAAFSRVDGRQ